MALMELVERQAITVKAIELMNMLENCEDSDFVDFVLNCVASNDTYSLEAEIY